MHPCDDVDKHGMFENNHLNANTNTNVCVLNIEFEQSGCIHFVPNIVITRRIYYG